MKLNKEKLNRFDIAMHQIFFGLTSHPTDLELVNDRFINHTSS